VCDQPNQEWCIGRPNDHTCVRAKRIRIRIRIFMNEVRILERKKEFKIHAYPIRRETCNPAGGGFCRIVEIRPDPDSRIGYPSIPNTQTHSPYLQIQTHRHIVHTYRYQHTDTYRVHRHTVHTYRYQHTDT